jgi:hypothetical protein
MSARWTVLACLGVLALALGAVVAFEAVHSRTAAQRQEFANSFWPVVGVVIIALWAWNLAGRRRPRR